MTFADVARHLLDGAGVNPDGGRRTGMNAFHWAANRAPLRIVDKLLDALLDRHRRS